MIIVETDFSPEAFRESFGEMLICVQVLRTREHIEGTESRRPMRLVIGAPCLIRVRLSDHQLSKRGFLS